MAEKVYVAIDLKSFYASAECVARGLDPLHTNLVVADAARTEKTICLAVSPSLKGYGISGRARLFEVVQKVAAVNEQRQRAYPQHRLYVREYDDRLIRSDPSLALDYIVAPPRMAYYMEISTKIYQIYLRYVAPEDIHVYSIDEVFIDATNYLPLYGLNARGFARKLMAAVLQETGITATAGVGPNLFLCKVAMDVGAKHIKPDKNGARIAELDERSFREKLWSHRPLTDFWRVGKGYAKKLEANGMYTLGDVARRSLTDEDLLYRLFGVNAELLIDHAWGWEPVTLADIKGYRPEKSSMGAGQVLSCPYPADKARLVVREMADALALDLVQKRVVARQLVLTVGYDRAGRTDGYTGPLTTDPYGRSIPKPAHGTEHLPCLTASSRYIIDAAMTLFDRIVDPRLPVRADVGFVHVFDVRGVFTEELRSAAVAVVFFRTASVVGQRSDACGKLHAQSHARYHWRLGIFGYEVVVHFDNAVAVHLVCNVPAGIGLWKAVGHFYCCGVLAPHNVEVFGFRFLIACFFPCFQSYGKPGSIIVVDRCTPEEGAGTLSIMDKFLFLVSVGYQQAALLVECGCEVCTGEGELSAIIFRSGKCLLRSVFLMESIDIGLLAGNDCACRKERFGGTDGSIEFNAYVSG